MGSMNLKELMNADLDDVFLDIDENASIHNINGIEMLATVDKTGSRLRSDRKSERYDGIYTAEAVVYAKAAQFVKVPVHGQPLHLDGKLYLVDECINEEGMLEITLTANDS